MKKNSLFIIIFLMILSVNGQNWLKDIDQAQKEAKLKNHKIILVFQGSDWCAPCIKLDHKIWSKTEFIDFANDHYVMVQVDFPRKKKNKLDKAQQAKNNALADQYNKRGFFPYVVVLDKNKKILGTTSYKNISVSEYIKLLEAF
jgi:thioredoxin-related protein